MSLETEKIPECKLFDPSDKIPDFEIDNETRKALCFSEDLIVSLKDESSSETKPLGSYCVSIENIGPKGSEFMIQVISSSTINGSLSGARVLSSTTAKFHCLEEKRREYIHREDGLHEKTLFIGLEDDLYHLQGSESCPCNESEWQKDLSLSSNSEIISEGANVLLMRYLALTNFHGSLSFKSVMIGGQLTTCDYVCSEARSMKFNDKTVQVYTIERIMHEECGLVHRSKTHMTQSGYILRHDWLEVPYSLEINSIINPNSIDRDKSRIVSPLRSRWTSDAQMVSLYLDEKTREVAQQSEYLADHPEIKQLISDYAQTLLAVKPINVLAFTIQHFAAFAECPDPSELVKSAESNSNVKLQMFRNKQRRVCSVCGICFDCPMPVQPRLDSEGDHGARSSRYPPPEEKISKYSLCSVFKKCPSDASCARKLPGSTGSCSEDCKACKINGKINSVCSFGRECEKTCNGCLKIDGKMNSVCSFGPECKKTCDGCLKIDGKINSVCSFGPDCEKTCNGCLKIDGKINSVCSFGPECKKTCNGCLKIDGKMNSVCSFGPKCKKTCNGCLKIDGKTNSVCSFGPDCEKTCNGCLKIDGKINSVCSFGPGCEKRCDGCLKSLRKPCPIHRACPECPGCHKVCSEIGICPNCEKCNVEILPDDSRRIRIGAESMNKN